MSAQDEFHALLRQAGLTLVCPACGGTGWGVVRDDLIVPSTSGSRQAVFLIRCNTCGHQRFFSPEEPGGELQGE